MNRPRAGSIGAQGQQQQYSQQQQYVPPPPPQNQQASPQRQQRSGPRANCDQVVFEAIAKAAEIVVASRCNIESDPSSASQSGRFNLLVPEVKSVRNILQRWKRTMHVPLRLDVYYQHPPKANNEAGERELLERWCLEYAPTTSHAAAGMYDEQQYSLGHVDPIVQLRKVCKNIVVWLRTLYCHSRLLPAQALRKNQSTSSNNCIGFSIYVVGEGQDDVSGLLQSGFDSEPKPSGEGLTGVPTPYGVLGWRVYLAPRELVRRLLAIEAEKARVLQQQYANTSSSIPRSIPMKVVQAPTQSATNSGVAQPVARSAPTHNRGYRRSNSDSVAAHSPSQQLFQRQQQQQDAPEQTRYYSRSPAGRNSASPSTLLAPRSYHHQGGLLRRNSDVTNNQRGLYPIESSGNLASNNNSNTDSPSSGTSRSGAGGINPNKNLSALSLALLSMKTDTDSSSPDPSESDNAAAAELGPSEIRRAALHNAPPSSATGVGEYGYAYNTSTTPTNTQQQQQQNIHPNLSSSPASVNPMLFKGPSTPASSTFGTTPPGYLLSATPSVGSHGTMNLGTTPGGGMLVPPARAASAGPNSVAPPFVRPLGFAGQAPNAAAAAAAAASTTSQPSPQAAEFQQQQQQLQFQSPPPQQLGGVASTPEDQKPSLDLLHSSPFHHSAMGGMHNGSSNHPSSSTKDGLASFLQAEENASMEAATTFINDFYHHHYPMASLTDSPHHHHSATEDYHHHSSGLFAEHASSILDPHELHQAEDMPFAVEGISSGLTPTGASTSLLKHNMSTHEASLMAASMMVPHKKLALFGSTTEHPNDAAAPSEADDIDALTDQLADFRSFGATLASPLTTSVGSGG